VMGYKRITKAKSFCVSALHVLTVPRGDVSLKKQVPGKSLGFFF
jgi:hypothetical protein